MRTWATLVLVVAAAVGCGKRGAPPLSSSSLWALAPPGTRVAVVVRDGALPPLLRGLRILATKAGQAVGDQVKGLLAKLPIDVLDDTALTAAGVDADRGLAVFGSTGAIAFVAPVGDEKKWQDRLGASWTCRRVHGRFACATTEELLGKVGTSVALADEVKRASLDMRGDVEAYSATPPDMSLPIDDPRGLWMAAHFAPGAVTLRAHLVGKPRLPPIPPMTLAKGVAEKRPAGFLFAQAGPFLGSLGRTGARLPGGLGLAEVVQALTGEVVGWVPTGAPARGYAIIGVKDTAVARRLLDACADFTLEPWVTTRKLGDVCQTTLQPPDLAISIPLETRLEADGLALGFGAHAAKGDGGGDVPPFALELFDRPWAFASWGRGIFASVLPDILLATPGASPSIMRGVLGVLGKLTELGLAVGWDADGYVAVLRVETTFANPDDVVAALDPLIERAAGGDRSAVAEIQALAQKHPDTPLGAAMRGGSPLAIAAAAIVPGIVMSLIHLAR